MSTVKPGEMVAQAILDLQKAVKRAGLSPVHGVFLSDQNDCQRLALMMEDAFPLKGRLPQPGDRFSLTIAGVTIGYSEAVENQETKH